MHIWCVSISLYAHTYLFVPKPLWIEKTVLRTGIKFVDRPLVSTTYTHGEYHTVCRKNPKSKKKLYSNLKMQNKRWQTCVFEEYYVLSCRVSLMYAVPVIWAHLPSVHLSVCARMEYPTMRHCQKSKSMINR